MAYLCKDCDYNINRKCDYRERMYPISLKCAYYSSTKVIPIEVDSSVKEDYVYSTGTAPKAIFYSRLSK